ncbi:MAG: hypothetical protein ACTSWN_03750 [Promethearchaeota archaeon]
MNVVERLVAALDVQHGRKPDKVPNYLVSLRPSFMKVVDDNVEIEEDDILYDPPHDLTIAKAIGAESIKCGPHFHVGKKIRMPIDYLLSNQIPEKEWNLYSIDPFGIILKKNLSTPEEFSTWYIDGYLTTEEKLNKWLPYLE